MWCITIKLLCMTKYGKSMTIWTLEGCYWQQLIMAQYGLAILKNAKSVWMFSRNNANYNKSYPHIFTEKVTLNLLLMSACCSIIYKFFYYFIVINIMLEYKYNNMLEKYRYNRPQLIKKTKTASSTYIYCRLSDSWRPITILWYH